MGLCQGVWQSSVLAKRGTKKMKRLLFSVTGATLIAAMSGCGGVDKEFAGLTTGTGAKLEIVDSPADIPPASASAGDSSVTGSAAGDNASAANGGAAAGNNASAANGGAAAGNNASAANGAGGKDPTWAEKKAAKEAADKEPVRILRTDAEVALSVRETTLANIIKALDQVVNSGNMQSVYALVVHINGRPQITEAALRKYAGAQLTPGAIIALRALLEKEITAHLEAKVYPAMAKATLATVRPFVERSVAQGKFALAREAIWRASTSGIPWVDSEVRKECRELMHGLVNPGNWDKAKAEIKATFDAAMKAKKYNEGISNLRKIEKELIAKEYTALIDKKLVAVKLQLVALGVAEADMKPILDKQGALIAAAANIADNRDEYVTLEAAKVEQTEVEARKDPVLKEYYARLDDFHDTLIAYDCTKDNADKITKDLDRELRALIELLRKPAKFRTDKTGAKTALMLGTHSLNVRIHKEVDTCVKALEQARDAAEIARLKSFYDAARKAWLAKLAAAKAELEKKVRELVKAGKFEEARELIWNAPLTKVVWAEGEWKAEWKVEWRNAWKVEWDTELFGFGLGLLRDLVNPTDWARIEKDIRGTYAKLSGKGDFVALRKFLEEYPLIRQHTVQLCDQLAKVRAEAEALGANPEAAAAAAKVACGMVTEAEQLVDHLDQIVASAAKSGKALDKSKLQKELEIYRVKLAAYHATPENVAKISKALEQALEELIKKPTNPKTTRLMLGTNAVNDRIRKLTAELLSTIEQKKKDWEDAEHKRVMTDLEKRVRAAVKEKRFDDARNYIRDEKLIGREEYDLDIYVLRVGLLDCCVNPAQLDFLLAEIDKKIAELMKAKDYVGVIKFCEEYKGVHDQYAQIDSALEAVKNAMLALEISKDESSLDKKRFFASIQEILEKRRETWKPERDLQGVEKALAEVARALYAHLIKHPELIGAETAKDLAHIREDLAKLERNITTWELNQLLRRRLYEDVVKGYKLSYYNEAKKQLERQEYGKLLSTIDAEVSFDSQIAIAEEAISRQLGVKCDTAAFKVNALLGEYARMFRLLKKGVKLDAAQATSILLGAAYLDQAQVIKRALDLGADVNGVSDRDPRGRTALALAIDAGNSHLVKQLVEAEASLTATDKDGNAIIHYVAKSGNLSVLKVVTAGASVDVKNNLGNTPLAIAVVRNQPALVEAVIAAVEKSGRKAFVNSANNQDETAFDIAAHFGSRDVLDALAAAGAEYGTKDLVLAEKADHVAIAQWLVNQGLDVNAEGVMDDACPATRTGRYLISEGGLVSKHACVLCDDKLKKDALEKLVVGPEKDASTKECEANCQPQPVDVLLVPSAK